MKRYVLKINETELNVEKFSYYDFPRVKYDIFLKGVYLFTFHTIEMKSVTADERLNGYLGNIITETKLLEFVNNDSDMPTTLKKSVEFCIRKEKMNEVTAMLLLDYDKYKIRINKMFEEASSILNQTVDEVFRCTDYYYKDQKANRLNNAFAEVRAVMALDQSGFTNIRLISSRTNEKCVDLIAWKDSRKYVIDVAHFTDSFDIDYEKRFTDKTRFKYYIENKYRSKKEQIFISREREKADEQALFIMIDEINGLYALHSEDEIKNYLYDVHSALDFIDECRLIICFNGETYCF